MSEQTERSVTPTEPYVKCDGRGAVCKTLRKRLGNGHVKGLNSMTMMNWQTCEELNPILAYKTSAHDNGIVLNFCPFCGAELNLDYLKPSATR